MRHIAVLGLLAFPALAEGQEPVQLAARRAAAAAVRPGDEILLHILREPLLSDTIAVNERGDAAFPKLGVMNVGSLSISTLQDTLLTLYSRYLRNPALQAIVLRRVAVNGEVKRPDVYLVDVSTTLADVIARAGGVAENGNPDKVSIIRNGQTIRVPNWQADASRASDLLSGDQVYVARKSWWAINALPTASVAIVATSLIVSVLKK